MNSHLLQQFPHYQTHNNLSMANSPLGKVTTVTTIKNGVTSTKIVELIVQDGKIVPSDTDTKQGVER